MFLKRPSCEAEAASDEESGAAVPGDGSRVWF